MNTPSYVYILASAKYGTLYVGVTSDLKKRVFEHKEKQIKGFTQKYGVDRLVYYEITFDIRSAIERETCIKRWKRNWKIQLIEEKNPDWCELSIE